jgi:phosphoribosylamine--glycine ligase
MKILIVGGGGREHALAAKIAEDAPDAELFVAPGNPGTASLGTNVGIPAGDLAGLASFAGSEAIDLTVVGPEQPLAAGIAERFEAAGLPLFGPSSRAARLEASKAFAKTLMRDRRVATAGFEIFTDAAAAEVHLSSLDPPIVVKASGLAAGKGAIICESREEALAASRSMLVEDHFGEAGREVVVEEFMTGEELSVFFLTDGERAVPLVTSRDHKRRYEGDRGPNTGGMGAYAPVADGTPELVERVRRQIAEPVLEGLADLGCPYRGFLYAGLMLTPQGPRVVEFNCRMGDPEAQAVLPLTGGNLLEPMLAVARGESLGHWTADTRPDAALVTVVVSGGYPGPYDKGLPIRIPADQEDPNVIVYHAGTAIRDDRLVTAGGRVVGVTGIGADLAEASARSRDGAARVQFKGADFRRDIGYSEIEVATAR